MVTVVVSFALLMIFVTGFYKEGIPEYDDGFQGSPCE